MDVDRLIESLASFPAVLRGALHGVTQAEARRAPPSGGWSLLEAVTHIAEEEQLDFRPRVERTLRDGSEAWDPIDPEGWVTERRYNEGDLEQALARFEAERARSVDWLRGLGDADWESAHPHPVGDLRAGDLLASWAAHDWLHLRQIARLRVERVKRHAEPFDTRYAGA
jgi:hypothetical protein